MSKKKLFVVSDVHSFYTIMKDALDKAGFDPNNENHWLIVCGDCFDRGDESEEMLHYLMSLERKVLIRGNHDDLLEECCERGYPQWHDNHNFTTQTINDIGGACEGKSFSECCLITYNKMAAYRNLLVNYFETKNYIFVHGWIPCEYYENDYNPNKPWHQYGKTYRYNPNWRDCNDVEWYNARWINGIKRGREGIIEPNKTIVCGHWHCSYGHHKRTGSPEHDVGAIWDPYYDDGMIAIDRCTATTYEVNVLELEDEFLEDEE